MGGKDDAAMELYNRALTIYKKALGEEHSKVGDTCYNMAIVLKRQGNFDKAFGFYQNAFEVYRKFHGETHPETADALQQMAFVLREQGKDEEAAELERIAEEGANEGE